MSVKWNIFNKDFAQLILQPNCKEGPFGENQFYFKALL